MPPSMYGGIPDPKEPRNRGRTTEYLHDQIEFHAQMLGAPSINVKAQLVCLCLGLLKHENTRRTHPAGR